MQKTSRTPPVIAINSAETKVVRLQRRKAETGDDYASPPEEMEVLSALMERASNAVRQMKYFCLASKQFSLDELVSSARRAGFVPVEANPRLKEVSFQWASGQPDWIFSVSFRDPARLSIGAQSQADIFGLILTAYAHAATVSVEINPTVQESDLGRNALLFKDMLLTFPDFHDMPAWANYPEGCIPETGGWVRMWRDGVSVASVFGRAWNSICARVLTLWDTYQNRS